MPNDDFAHEEAILGMAIASPDQSMPVLVEQGVRFDGFGNPANAALFKAISECWLEQKGTQFMAVATHLGQEEFARLGGAGRFTELTLAAPPFNKFSIENYCSAFRDAWAKRRLGAMLGDMRKRWKTDKASELISDIELGLTEISNLREPKKIETTKEIVSRVITSLSERAQGGTAAGMSTGMPFLDAETGGIRLGGYWVIGGPTKGGKAQSLDSMIQTPRGPIRMGDAYVGMEVCTPYGGTARVIALHPQGMKMVYRMETASGHWTECCEEHIWRTRRHSDLDYHNRTTGALIDDMQGLSTHMLPENVFKNSSLRDRIISSIYPVCQKECQCITLDSEDGMYLTDHFIPTHNSSMARFMAHNLAVVQTNPIMVFNLEMGNADVVEAILATESKVSATRMRDGKLLDSDMPKLMMASGKIASAPIYFRDDVYDIAGIRAYTRYVKSVCPNLAAVFVDYVQLTEGGSSRRESNREQEIASVSKALRRMAKDENVAVIALSQLNDDGELRECRALGMDATVQVTIELTDDPCVRYLKLRQRQGRTGVRIPVRFVGETFEWQLCEPCEIPEEQPKKRARRYGR